MGDDDLQKREAATVNQLKTHYPMDTRPTFPLSRYFQRPSRTHPIYSCLSSLSLSTNPPVEILQLTRVVCQTTASTCLGVPGGRLDMGSLWSLYKMRETLWFCLVSDLKTSVRVLGLCCVYLCRSISLYDCLVVNGTSKFIINIHSRHGY